MNKILKIKNLIIGPGKPAVCVPIIGHTEQEIISEIRKIKGLNADLAEWRADFFDDIMNVNSLKRILEEMLREFKGLPFIFTIRTKNEGGRLDISPEEYIKINQMVCESNTADMIDIELNVGEEFIGKIIKVAHENQVKVVISKHDFENTPTHIEIVSTLMKMQNLGGDIAKMAVMPKSKRDLLTLLSATEEMFTNFAKIPIVTMSMDKEGFASRILGEIFGSAITFGSLNEPSAPGQIEAKELSKILDSIHESIKRETNNILIIGFMGTGKTTVSNELSRLTSMKMVDTDHYIENKTGKKIQDIFKEYGEAYFRDIETDSLVEILSKDNQLISCGGGIVLRDENIKYMKEHGKVILLTASAKAILQRVKKEDTRPLISQNTSEEEIAKLFEKRSDKYFAATDLVIDTTDKTVEEICNEIINKI